MLALFVSRDATRLSYLKVSCYTKDVTAEINWTFELAAQSGIDVSKYVIFGFTRKDQFNHQQRNNETFHRTTVVTPHSFIGEENYRYAGINCIMQ